MSPDDRRVTIAAIILVHPREHLFVSFAVPFHGLWGRLLLGIEATSGAAGLLLFEYAFLLPSISKKWASTNPKRLSETPRYFLTGQSAGEISWRACPCDSRFSQLADLLADV